MLMLVVRFIDRLVGAIITLSSPQERALRLTVVMLVLTSALFAVCGMILLLVWGAIPR